MSGVLFHCINGIGLGHLRRQVQIALELQALSPEIEVSFLTTAEEHHWIRAAGFPYYYMPSEAHYRFTWSATPDEIGASVRRRSAPTGLHDALVREVVAHVRPAVVVFDTYFSERNIQDLLGVDATPVAFYDNDRNLDMHRAGIRSVLSASGYVLLGVSEPNLPTWLDSTRTLPVGRVVPKPDLDRSSMLAESLTGGPLVVCAQGGGGFTRDNSVFYRKNPGFISVVLDALQTVSERMPGIYVVFVLGPYGRWPDNRDVPSWAEVRGFEPNLLELVAAADLMVARGGYNAVSDSIGALCPGIFLPIQEPTEDQRQHVADLVRAGAAVSVGHSAVMLADELAKLLGDSARCGSMRARLATVRGKENGAGTAAREIVRLAGFGRGVALNSEE